MVAKKEAKGCRLTATAKHWAQSTKSSPYSDLMFGAWRLAYTVMLDRRPISTSLLSVVRINATHQLYDASFGATAAKARRLPRRVRTYDGERSLGSAVRCLCLLLALPALCLGCSAGGTATVHPKQACIDAPVDIGRQALPSGRNKSLSVGGIIYVELIKPERYSSAPYPPGFPWLTPASSPPSVLKQVPICATRLRPSTLSLRVSAFEALRDGSARIVAPLASTWRRLKPAQRQGLDTYDAVVHVQDRAS